MKSNITIDTKQVSHYLRSRVVSIHSSLSLVMLKEKDPSLKEELGIARDTLIQQELSRIDLLYYSLLKKGEYEDLITNHVHKESYPNIEAISLKKNFLARIDFLIHILSNLVEKARISSEGEMITIELYVQDHNDDRLTVCMFANVLEKVLALESVDIVQESWGYTLQFMLNK